MVVLVALAQSILVKVQIPIRLECQVRREIPLPATPFGNVALARSWVLNNPNARVV